MDERWHDRFHFVPGNHDFDSIEHYDNVHTPFAAERNFDGDVIELEGVKLAGLGRIFSGKIWYPRSSLGANEEVVTRKERLKQTPRKDRLAGGMGLSQRKYIFREDVEALAKRCADILVTHEAPSCHKHGFIAIDDLARRMGVRTIVHGHHHMDYHATLPGGILVIGVGLRGLTNLAGQVIRAGEKSRVNGSYESQYGGGNDVGD